MCSCEQSLLVFTNKSSSLSLSAVVCGAWVCVGVFLGVNWVGL